MIEITQHQMLAIMVARWGLPFIGMNIEGAFAQRLHDRFNSGAANDE